MYLTGGGLAPVKETADIEETTAGRLRITSYVKQVRADGSPSCVVRPDFIGLLLYGAMGAKAVSGAGPYVHVFTLASVLPYLTAWRRLGPAASGGLYEKFADCKVGQLVIASQAGGLLIATPTILGLGPSWLTAAEDTVAVEVANAFLHADGEGALKVEGAAVASIESSEWSIGNGAVAIQGDAVSPYIIAEGMLDITVKTTQLVTDFALWNQYIYGDRDADRRRDAVARRHGAHRRPRLQVDPPRRPRERSSSSRRASRSCPTRSSRTSTATRSRCRSPTASTRRRRDPV